MQDGYVESRGVRIHYVANAHRAGRTCLLFVPGVMMPAWIWEKQLSYFSQTHNVVAMEPRSQGLSGQTSEGLYAAAMAQDIQVVVEALHLYPLVLVGWSIGVPQVLQYAVQYDVKRRLIGLVLVEGIVGASPEESFYASMVEQWTHFQLDRPAMTREFLQIIFKQPQSQDYLQRLYEVAMRTPTGNVMALIFNYILQDFRPLLLMVDVPTWIATIEGPRLGYMRQMNSLLRNSQLDVFPSAGHALFVDQPEDFNRALESFSAHLAVDTRS